MRVLLLMRKSLAWHADHIATLRQMGLDLHLITEVKGLEAEGRFASVLEIPHGQDADETVCQAVTRAHGLGIDTALTLTETDIMLASQINEQLGREWARPGADRIARDKRLQREFLAATSIPSVEYATISDVAEGPKLASRLGYPLIVKPTHAAFSRGVALVRGDAELLGQLHQIKQLADSGEGNYYTGRERSLALLEEFLPGTEVTVDGVVLFGRFYLVGVINKMPMPGPYFEEDYYTLPFRNPDQEPELAAIAQAIADGLGVEHCLFNVELRQDAAGHYRVVEFSTRMSGGQNYANLRDVYAIDQVRLFTKALFADSPQAVLADEAPRLPPRRATCIKYAYRTGVVLRNTAGYAALSPYFQSYIPVAQSGDLLRRAPAAYDIAGSLSVAASYAGPSDLDRIEAIADDLDQLLDVLVVPAGGWLERRLTAAT